MIGNQMILLMMFYLKSSY